MERGPRKGVLEEREKGAAHSKARKGTGTQRQPNSSVETTHGRSMWTRSSHPPSYGGIPTHATMIAWHTNIAVLSQTLALRGGKKGEECCIVKELCYV